MSEVATIRDILGDVLHLGLRADDLREDTPLLGHLPELDSMAVVAVLTEVERHYGIVIDDGDVTADVFATVGSLARFVEQRIRV